MGKQSFFKGVGAYRLKIFKSVYYLVGVLFLFGSESYISMYNYFLVNVGIESIVKDEITEGKIPLTESPLDKCYVLICFCCDDEAI